MMVCTVYKSDAFPVLMGQIKGFFYQVNVDDDDLLAAAGLRDDVAPRIDDTEMRVKKTFETFIPKVCL
jgi:hypothetical protein